MFGNQLGDLLNLYEQQQHQQETSLAALCLQDWLSMDLKSEHSHMNRHI
jgi:hypothetical protein